MTDKKRGKKTSKQAPNPKHKLTIRDLGWSKEQAAELRAQFAAFAEDWDDASMDVYDEL